MFIRRDKWIKRGVFSDQIESKMDIPYDFGIKSIPQVRSEHKSFIYDLRYTHGLDYKVIIRSDKGECCDDIGFHLKLTGQMCQDEEIITFIHIVMV